MICNKIVNLFVILIIKWCNGRLYDNSVQQFDVNSFENDTELNGTIELENSERFHEKRSTSVIKLDSDNGYTYLNIGVLMASHLGEL